ncbi:MAG: carbohydrate ABC transporter permease, partial [Aristaeellaceae bacterium]
MPIKEGGLSRKVFVVCNSIFLFLMMIVTLYPLWLQFITSISHGLEVMKGGVTLLPRSPTLETYKTIVRGELFMYMKNTIVYTVAGTTINLVMSCLCAYPLSRKTFSGRKFHTMMVTFTMFFSGGMIPLYLTVKQFGM